MERIQTFRGTHKCVPYRTPKPPSVGNGFIRSVCRTPKPPLPGEVSPQATEGFPYRTPVPLVGAIIDRPRAVTDRPYIPLG